ncbi:hypothetical protein LINPERPRIM_LOCUS21664, partial [Linum perenne]
MAASQMLFMADHSCWTGDTTVGAESSTSNGKKSTDTLGVFMRLPHSE